MTRFLKSRSSNQCRSHYQKYEIKYGNFDRVVEYLESKLKKVSQAIVEVKATIKKEEVGTWEKPVQQEKKELIALNKENKDGAKKENVRSWSLE